jgi:para-aminobenzoate synthetase component 1
MPIHTLPYPVDEAQLFTALARRWPDAVWLDGDAPGSRYSILAADPVERLHADAANAIGGLREALGRGRPGCGPPPFAGGVIGAFSYDLGRVLRGLAPRPGAGAALLAARYDWVVVRDHEARQSWLAGPAASSALARQLRTLAGQPGGAGPARVLGPVEADLDEARYAAAFERVRAYLRDGDCYQVNLARRLRARFEGDPLAAYLRLRRISPAPFAAFLGFAGHAMLSVSPERFMRVVDAAVETRPIKGTRRREARPEADAAAAAELRASAKDRAENLMIVDLLRNDLGQVCRIGSVRVPALFELESHPTVHHLVSTVTGMLREDCDAVDLLAASLPGGSVTGAPKRRAMEIIDELEPTPRGVYCGAIGYIGYDGAMDTSIAIRTATVAGGDIEYRAGGGLVWDSDVWEEFAETEAKALAFRRLIDALV